MKIFNWVHRKFHHTSEGYVVSPKKDDFLCNDDNPKTVPSETDTKALLDQITFMDVWKDGILAIGTFGFDEYVEEEFYINKEEEEDDRSVPNVEELNPTVKFSDTKAEKLASPNLDNAITRTNIKVNVEETPDTTPLLDASNEKKRVTLADLLSVKADVVVEVSVSNKLSIVDSSMKSAGEKKSVLSFGKKNKGEDSRPKRKLHRMISKMLKRKIYPDVESKIHGKDGLNDTMKKTMDTSASEKCNLPNVGRRIGMISLLQGAVSQA